MIIYEIEQHSEAWHQARLGRVTGTTFKNLCSKFDTDSWKGLITNITCQIITGKEDPHFVNAAMEEGTETEDEARDTYAATMEVLVKQVGFVVPDEGNPFHEWIGVSPDGLVIPSWAETDKYERGVEIKCPLQKTQFERIMTGRLPAEYRHQVQGGLFVTGLSEWDFMSYVPGMKPFIIRVEPDLNLFKTFEERLKILIEQVNENLLRYMQYDPLA